jgi:hypothetical protein
MKRTIKTLFESIIMAFELPPLDLYGIPERPRRNVIPNPETRQTEHRVHNGKIHRDIVTDDGVIETKIGHDAPKTSNDVTIDAFDVAAFDAFIGPKWAKSRDRAVIMKWHWLNGHSARQIEQSHTDKQTRKCETGFSERTAAEYVRALYEADSARDQVGKPRLRDAARAVDVAPEKPGDAANRVEW